MSDLRTLYPDSRYNITSSVTNPYNVIYVYDSAGINSIYPTSTGKCCLWTVPTGATWAKFEVWGGGGPGGGSCCCQQPQQPGGAGSYARKTIRVVPGQQYTVCAAAPTCCYSACQAPAGYPSYACGNNSNTGITYPLCLCASGGWGGFSQCFTVAAGCYHCLTCVCGTTCGADLSICGTTGASHNSSCGYDGWTYTPDAPYLGGGMRTSADFCAFANAAGISMSGYASFPGGGGAGANTTGGNCYCGGPGAPGLVVITYK